MAAKFPKDLVVVGFKPLKNNDYLLAATEE